MAVQFEGRTFPTLKAWKDEYPAYARFADRLRAGAATVVDMEREIAAAKARARAASIAGARKAAPYTFSKKAKGRHRG